MKQRSLNNFTKFFNLFFATANIAICHIWFVFDLHHCDCWINFRWQRNVNLIFVTINTEKSSRFMLFSLYSICSSFGFYTYPTRIPSSISVGATESAKSTTNLANCLTLMIYFGSSESALMIFVQRATYSRRFNYQNKRSNIQSQNK